MSCQTKRSKAFQACISTLTQSESQEISNKSTFVLLKISPGFGFCVVFIFQIENHVPDSASSDSLTAPKAP